MKYRIIENSEGFIAQKFEGYAFIFWIPLWLNISCPYDNVSSAMGAIARYKRSCIVKVVYEE